MSVKADLPRIKRQWKDSDYDSVSLVFVPTTPGRDAVMGELLAAAGAAIDVANEVVKSLRADGVPEFACTEPWPGPRGPVFSALIADTVPAMEAWIRAFGAHLDTLGIEGTLTIERDHYPGVYFTRVMALTAVIAVTEWTPAPRHRSSPGWFNDPVLGRQLIDKAVNWTADGSESIHLGLGLSMYMRPVSIVGPLIAASSARNTTPVVVNNPDPQHLRYACFNEEGRLILQLRDDDRLWPELVAELTTWLTDLADISEFGFIRHAYSNQTNLFTMLAGHPPESPSINALHGGPGFYWQSSRYLDSEYVPDAYGVQVLTDAHLARTADLTDWNVRPLGGGRNLVEHRDAAAWFATNPPDPALVDTARADFADAILPADPPPQPLPE